jgi:hypothetical protein
MSCVPAFTANLPFHVLQNSLKLFKVLHACHKSCKETASESLAAIAAAVVCACGCTPALHGLSKW